MKLKPPCPEVDAIILDFLQESYIPTTPTSNVGMDGITYRVTLIRDVHALCRELGVAGYTSLKGSAKGRWVDGSERLYKLLNQLYQPADQHTFENLGLRVAARLCCLARHEGTPSSDLAYLYARRRKLKLLASHAS